MALYGWLYFRDAEGVIQIAKQLPDTPATGRRRRVTAEHLNDDWCRAPASLLNMISTDS
jgi:hypothetical protein